MPLHPSPLPPPPNTTPTRTRPTESAPALRETGQSRGSNEVDSLTLAHGSVPIPFKTPLRDAELCQHGAEELTEHANKVEISLTWKE